MRYQRAEHPLILDGLKAARGFFAGCFADAPRREILWVAHVDDQARCLHLTRHDGDASGAEFPLRSIIADAAVHGSAGLILAHNHPSGDARPSPADCRATRRLASAAEALDCAIIDHLVFAGSQCTSLRGLGCSSQSPPRDFSGRGTIRRRANGGGVDGAAPITPPPSPRKRGAET